MPLVQVTDRPTETPDAADLLRLDDEGGMGSETGAWRPTAPASGLGGAGWGVPRGTIPGEREPGPQTRFGGPSTSTPNSFRLADVCCHDCRSSARRRRSSEPASSSECRIGLETDMADGAWFAHFRAPALIHISLRVQPDRRSETPAARDRRRGGALLQRDGSANGAPRATDSVVHRQSNPKWLRPATHLISRRACWARTGTEIVVIGRRFDV